MGLPNKSNIYIITLSYAFYSIWTSPASENESLCGAKQSNI